MTFNEELSPHLKTMAEAVVSVQNAARQAWEQYSKDVARKVVAGNRRLTIDAMHIEWGMRCLGTNSVDALVKNVQFWLEREWQECRAKHPSEKAPLIAEAARYGQLGDSIPGYQVIEFLDAFAHLPAPKPLR